MLKPMKYDILVGGKTKNNIHLCIQLKEEYKHWLQMKTLIFSSAYKRKCKIKSVVLGIKICT